MERKEVKKKRVLCYALHDFLNIIDTVTDSRGMLPENAAVISICPYDCEVSGEFHYLSADMGNVLNMDFDDGGPEEYWNGEDRYDYLLDHWLDFGNECSNAIRGFNFISNYDHKTPVHFLDYGQSYEMVKFIDRMMNDDRLSDIYVHCTAGASRSQGVVRYILDTYDGNGFSISLNEDNPCLTPNAHVVMMLKRVARVYFDWKDLESKYNNLVNEVPEEVALKRNVYEVNIENIYSNSRENEEETSYDLESLYEDELWFLMLCYFSNNDLVAQLDFCAPDKESRDLVCGRDLLNDVNFPWLYDYFAFDTDYIGSSMCRHPLRLYSPYYDSECSIISKIEVIHWLADGSRNRVELPKMSQLFKTREEMVNYMTGLFEEKKNQKKTIC